MNSGIIYNLQQEINTVTSSKSSRPYIFRTRLERVLERILYYSKNNSLLELEKMCFDVKKKMQFHSDRSNHTNDGSLNTYIYLKNDISNISEKLHEHQ